MFDRMVHPVVRDDAGGFLGRVARGITGADWVGHYSKKLVDKGSEVIQKKIYDAGEQMSEYVESGRAKDDFYRWLESEPGLEAYENDMARSSKNSARMLPPPAKRPALPSGESGKRAKVMSSNVLRNTVRKGVDRRMGFRKRRYGRKRFPRKRRGGNKTVTFQHDAVNTYRKGRMSRRGRRRLRRSFKRSVAQQLRGAALNTIKRVYNVRGQGAAGSQETMFIPGLYSLYGSAQWDDLQAICSNYQTVGTFASAAAAGTPDQQNSSKLMFTSATMEMDFCNTGTTPMIVEIYTCRTRDQGIPRISPNGDYVLDDYRPAATGDLSTLVTTRQYNSLFDSKQYCSRYEILGCQKVYLQAGASSDKSITLNKNLYFSPSSLINTNGNQFNFENKSVFWVLIITGAPEANAGAPRFSASELSVTTERTYKFKVMTGGNSTIASL